MVGDFPSRTSLKIQKNRTNGSTPSCHHADPEAQTGFVCWCVVDDLACPDLALTWPSLLSPLQPYLSHLGMFRNQDLLLLKSWPHSPLHSVHIILNMVESGLPMRAPSTSFLWPCIICFALLSQPGNGKAFSFPTLWSLSPVSRPLQQFSPLDSLYTTLVTGASQDSASRDHGGGQPGAMPRDTM